VPRLIAADAPDTPAGVLPAGALWAFVLSMAGAVLLWVAVSPSLWGWLPERLSTRAGQRTALVSQGLLPGSGSAGHLSAVGRLLAGPFAFAADQKPGDRTWAGLPVGGPVAVLVALATVAGVVLLVTAVVASPERLAVRHPPSLAAGWRWLGERLVGRRNAVALLLWALSVAVCAVVWPSARSVDAVPVVPVTALLAAVAVVVVSRWLSTARHSVGRGSAGDLRA
jgi:hypothetical protein